MMKSISAWKVIQIVILCALFLVPLGCRSYDQLGETAAEGNRRHKRVLAHPNVNFRLNVHIRKPADLLFLFPSDALRDLDFVRPSNFERTQVPRLVLKEISASFLAMADVVVSHFSVLHVDRVLR